MIALRSRAGSSLSTRKRRGAEKAQFRPYRRTRSGKGQSLETRRSRKLGTGGPAARLSARRGLLSRNDAGRIEDLLRKFDLPVKTHVDAGPVREALTKDKKRENEEIHFVLLDGIGNARVEPVEIHELDEVLDDLR